jgi:3-isopropylmalate dehydrogenase
MWMVKNPEWFDVIVTDNMFGDIITDLGAMIQGGMGIAAGGNINPEGVSMFEPIGGSAPKYTGMGVVSPLAAIAACQMMLDHLKEEKAAKGIEEAIMKVVEKDVKSLAAGKMGYSTSQVGDLVVKYLVRVPICAANTDLQVPNQPMSNSNWECPICLDSGHLVVEII